MSNSIIKKKEEVNLLVQDINNSKSIVLFESQGLKVSNITNLRRKIREFDSKIKLYPNNIIKRAFKIANKKEISELTKYSKSLLINNQDSVEPIKILYDFTKTNKFLKIIAGIFEDKFYTEKMIKEIANLPSKEVLLAMLSSSMLITLKELAISLDLLIKKDNFKNK
ncbi:50S ribosomal protein L10 [Candidatus Phytoplasma palmae]|uniref:50S ribosomal protein L10 n=1 Tax=Candidatus Phytoplasma palmae TaxID=85624 RepID=UPI0039907A7D